MNFQYEDDVKYSNCCGARDMLYHESGTHFSDIGICPECKDHCIYITREEMEREDDNR